MFEYSISFSPFSVIIDPPVCGNHFSLLYYPCTIFLPIRITLQIISYRDRAILVYIFNQSFSALFIIKYQLLSNIFTILSPCNVNQLTLTTIFGHPLCPHTNTHIFLMHHTSWKWRETHPLIANEFCTQQFPGGKDARSKYANTHTAACGLEVKAGKL